MAIVSSWVICAIITAAGGFPSDPDNPNYLARTDRELSVLEEAKWFRFPYPGKAKSTLTFLSPLLQLIRSLQFAQSLQLLNTLQVSGEPQLSVTQAYLEC